MEWMMREASVESKIKIQQTESFENKISLFFLDDVKCKYQYRMKKKFNTYRVLDFAK